MFMFVLYSVSGRFKFPIKTQIVEMLISVSKYS